MLHAKSIATDHKDIIQDVAYDYHGKRMATTSCDQFVKIWDFINGDWKCTASWKCHTGIIWRVTWAHPEFGQVIATCSHDRTTGIWEELPPDFSQESKWVKRGNLVDSRSSIVDVKFAPKHLGLKLATCSVDGNIRVYEAPDIMNLSQWTLQHEIASKVSLSCLSWGQSRMFPPTIAVGSDSLSSPSGVYIYEYNDNARSWTKAESIGALNAPVRDVAFAPNLGRSYDLLAVASKDVTILQVKPLARKESATQLGTSRYEIRNVAQFSDHQSQVWRLSWNITGTILASSGDDGYVRLWKGNYLEHWKCIATLRSDGSDDPGPSAASGAFSGFSVAATAGSGASGGGMAAAGTSSSTERSIPFYTGGRSSFSHGLPQSSAAAPPWH